MESTHPHIDLPVLALHSRGREYGGIPIVLLPPFPLDAGIWHTVQELLSDIWTIAVDPPGFGASTLPADDHQPCLDTYTQALAHALDQIDVHAIVLAGVSMGGYTTLSWARKYPDRLAGIALFDTSARADGPETKTSRLETAIRFDGGTDEGFLRGLMERSFAPQTLDNHETRAHLWDIYGNAPAPAVAWFQRAMAARPDSRELLETLTIPGAVARGESDALSPAHITDEMAAALSTSTVTIANAAHITPFENPHAVAEILRSVWGSVR